MVYSKKNYKAHNSFSTGLVIDLNLINEARISISQGHDHPPQTTCKEVGYSCLSDRIKQRGTQKGGTTFRLIKSYINTLLRSQIT